MASSTLRQQGSQAPRSWRFATTGTICKYIPSLASGPQILNAYFAAGGTGSGSGTTNATITRGTGAQSYQYVLSLPVQETLQAHQGALNANVQLSFVFKAVANLIPGDTNFDGVVNGLDLNTIAANWGHQGSLVAGDANGDGVVNGLDINMLAGNWLHSSALCRMWRIFAAVAAAPEPSTGIIFGVGTCGWWLLRRRKWRGSFSALLLASNPPTLP